MKNYQKMLVVLAVVVGLLLSFSSIAFAVSSDADLTSVHLEAVGSNQAVTLTPTFTKDTVYYSGTVVSSLTKLTVTITPSDNAATTKVFVGGVLADTLKGQGGCEVSLPTVKNTISLVVIAPDEATTKTYELQITKSGSNKTPTTTTTPTTNTNTNNNNSTAGNTSTNSGDSNTVLKLTVGSTTAYVNNQEVILDAAPFFYKYQGTAYTMVPIRFIGEQGLGAAVNWKADTKEVEVLKGNINIKMTLDEISPDDGLNCPPVVYNNRVFVPIRYVAESLGCAVQYKAVNQPIVITAP